MPVQEKDLIMITQSEGMNITAQYLAKKRSLYEYPRKAYGNYNTRGISKIKNGILGELAFLEYIHTFLENKTKDIPQEKRWKLLHEKIRFSYEPKLGVFDGGFEFKLGDLTVDIKTYESQRVNVSQIFNGLNNQGKPLNLFIDQSQHAQADIYIQVFLMENLKICLAGYYKGLPPKADWMPKPAYACPVTGLKPMHELLKYFSLNT